MINKNALLSDIIAIKSQSPLIHNTTNFVVMNNTANALLALGASPVMAHAVEEVSEMASLASTLLINMGTLSSTWVEAMVLAGTTAEERGIPCVLDPVGVGATSYRTQTCKQLIKLCKPVVIRGNASEIRALVETNIQTKGVDSTDSSASALEAAKSLALQTGAVVSVSGEIDYITDGVKVNEVIGGSAMMERVTGMGCSATAITAAFIAVNKDALQAATHAMELMSLMGGMAARVARGPGSLQLNFLDNLYQAEELVKAEDL